METDAKSSTKSKHQTLATDTSGNNNNNKTNDTEMLDVSHPPGRLIMLEPQARENYTPHYRLDEVSTFKWKYDDNHKSSP
jgi:hypothetical protein